ncbi:ABC transporter ATP-binding protein [uncultured Devosia sp.]|uniref:ABC transporter ATP-binding protein n=1 Tax=uncultured Devosia sp. TaxID=211434 RepID=UPI0035CC3A2A
MGALRLSGIGRSFGDFAAVSDLSLDVADGEFVTLLGPSGCGKTTTLRMVAGFISPDRGEIAFDGERINAVPPHRRDTGMVFQSYALFPHMIVADNVGFGLRMRGMPAEPRRERIAESLAMVNLVGLERRRPGELSGGQQQRVALARAIAIRPQILLFDEPLSNLDARLREKVRLEIRELQRRLGITTLYVTHDQAEALAMSDRIVVMDAGRIEQVGTPDEIYRSPATRFVADFVGAANIVDGHSLGEGVFKTKVGTLRTLDRNVPAGKPVTLIWRAEDMQRAGAGTPDIHDARVSGVVYHGGFVEVIVEVAGELLRAQLPSDTPPRVGDRIGFVVPAERVRLVGGS